MSDGKTAVEGGQPPAVYAGELGEIGVGDLCVADDFIEADVAVSNTVGPENVTRELRDPSEDLVSRPSISPLSDDEAEK